MDTTSMRDLGAELRPDIDRAAVSQRCRALLYKIGDGEKLVERTTGALTAWREEMGRALVELRTSFSARGDGFVAYVEKEIGIAHSTAQEYMAIVGYAPRGQYQIQIKPDSGLIPGSAAALVATLPRERQREIVAEIAKGNPKAVVETAKEIRSAQAAPRRERDAYLSAGGFVRPLLALLGPAPQTMIECCAGAGDLVVPLQAAGFQVVTLDVDPAQTTDYTGDATSAETWARLPPAEWVISNLPFNEAIRILPHALAHATVGVAVILRLTFLEPVKERAARWGGTKGAFATTLRDLGLLDAEPSTADRRWTPISSGAALIESAAWRAMRPAVVRPAIPKAVRLAVLARDGLVCRICRGPVERSDVHLDHVLTVKSGGPTTTDNLRVTHSRCNLRRRRT